MQYNSIINYTCRTIHYVPRTDLKYNWKLVPFDSLLPSHPIPTPASVNHHLFSEIFFYSTCNERIWYLSFLSDLSHVAQCPQDLSMLSQMARFLSFYGWIIFHFMYIQWFIYLWYLGYFHLLVMMNNTAINIQAQVSVGTYVFIPIEYKPGCGIAGSYGNFMFNFLRNHQTSFHSSCMSCTASSNVPGFLFLHIFSNTCYFLFSWFNLSWWVWNGISLWLWFAFFKWQMKIEKKRKLIKNYKTKS